MHTDAPPVVVTDGMTVLLGGREYRVKVDAPACAGSRHWHPERHQGEEPVWKQAEDARRPHHHHSAHCAEYPRQVTLYPAWELLPPRHGCDMSQGARCACGAWREELVPVTVKRKPGKVLYRYHKPADDQHPDGWSYERWEEVPNG